MINVNSSCEKQAYPISKHLSINGIDEVTEMNVGRRSMGSQCAATPFVPVRTCGSPSSVPEEQDVVTSKMATSRTNRRNSPRHRRLQPGIGRLASIEGRQDGTSCVFCVSKSLARALTGMVLLGNLAQRAGRPITWDAEQARDERDGGRGAALASLSLEIKVQGAGP